MVPVGRFGWCWGWFVQPCLPAREEVMEAVHFRRSAGISSICRHPSQSLGDPLDKTRDKCRGLNNTYQILGALSGLF
ncbi:uncharacterized protein B0H64DRAFT_395321 [Chaetomium fimeti]|uniref:Uncharacterized protein n=1 Tax=Chaetomium fimeti TaxID=1854472 RepID=A0AAE0LSA9_9PEZI|nr:hypothetical protein B0H64DRAFT_395321 [Chaetomium fimeti]